MPLLDLARRWNTRAVRASASLAVLALLGLLAAFGVHRLEGLIADDAYISFRYARNLVEGHGWTYNPGSPASNAATAPLYVLLLAAAYALHPDMLRNANLLFVLCVAGASWATFLTFWRRGAKVAAGLAAAFLATAPWLLSTRGMESALFLALFATTLALYDRERLVAAGVSAALLALVRGDGALLPVLLLAHRVISRKGELPVRLICGLALVALPWLAFSAIFLGELLPGTLSAKVAQGASGLWGHGLVFARSAWQLPFQFGFAGWWLTLLGLAAVGLASLLFDSGRGAVSLLVLLFAGLHFCAYALVLRVPGYHWYYTPQVFAVVWFAAIGGEYLLRRAYAQRDALALTAGAGASLAALVLAPLQVPRGFSYYDYVAAAEWLRAHSPANARVAASEIGVIGWHSERPMVDYLGLLTRASVEEVRRGDLTTWLAREVPDYWVVHAPLWPFEMPAAQLPGFDVAYKPVFTSGGVRILHRVGSLPPPGSTPPAATVVEDWLEELLAVRGVPRSEATRAALGKLLHLHRRRPDLQVAFGPPRALQLPRLVEWAASASKGHDSAAQELAPHRDLYLETAEALMGADLTVDLAGRKQVSGLER